MNKATQMHGTQDPVNALVLVRSLCIRRLSVEHSVEEQVIS